MLNVILFGPPGSGKGTQSEKLIQDYQLVHLSTGNILRDEVSRETPLGIEAKKIMDEGKLVSDDIVIGMIKSKLSQNPDAKGFIFDGFPRTVAQAEALDRLMDELGTPISILLSLEVPSEELKGRLLKRGEIEGRTDDNEETIAKRIREYLDKTTPVADYYQARGKLKAVEGVGSIDDIYARIQSAIG
ncbi:MAG: adenylate kinase [Taibaiella sp.]|nr:adenylate kinase [Taibaiella sp.]